MANNLNYENGIAPIVTAYGPGNLHYLTYGRVVGSIPNHVGMLPAPTGAENRTNFLLGFSYLYNDYSFYWDGEGPAFWRMAGSSLIEPVGTSWTNATSLPFGSTKVVLGDNVSAQAKTAQVNGQIIAYIIPDDLD
jgi:hypothetical protein